MFIKYIFLLVWRLQITLFLHVALRSHWSIIGRKRMLWVTEVIELFELWNSIDAHISHFEIYKHTGITTSKNLRKTDDIVFLTKMRNIFHLKMFIICIAEAQL